METTWTIKIDDLGVAWLRFDLTGEKVNKFTTNAMMQLDEVLDQVAADTGLTALVIHSGKADSFIVGADIAELAAIKDYEDAVKKARMGQTVFKKLADLSVPTVAVINGPCMGGGTEMALACDYRLATDHDKTALGLPEVKLGILPGWGGTQRLPGIVGLSQALTLIMSAKTVPGRKALKIGLVDGLIAPEFLKTQTQRFVSKIRSHHGEKIKKQRRKRQPLAMRLLEATRPGRALIFRQASKEVHKRTKGLYPAPIEALNVIRKTFGQPIDEGLKIEAEAFGTLAISQISRNLVWVFQASQRTKKTAGVTADDSTVIAEPKRLERAAVVGAGVMGGGIAWALSQKGMSVRMKDINWDAVAKGMAEAADMYRQLVKRRKMKPTAMNVAMHRIAGATDYHGFDKVDVVIEAVVEDMDIKKKVLAEVESKVGDETIIATNTSSLSISEMATALQHPDRFVGLHFFNPVNRMPLVEIIPGEKTSPETIVAVVELAKRLGKTPVVVGDCAGFLVNRVLLPYVNESIRMFEEGVDPQRIDRLIEKFGMPMGPLALADEVGLDVGLKVAHVLEDSFGDRMHVPHVLEEAVRSGSLLGKKTGQGFYTYNGRKKPNPKALDHLNGSRHLHENGQGQAIPDQQIVHRAILTMVNEAARCLEEGIVQDAETLDMAMLMGAGFAPLRGGLLRWADQQGLDEIAARLNALAGICGDRFKPAPLIEKLAETGEGFYPKAEARHF